ncbi:MAG TPA: NlpC/P60 family protein [Gaiellaceae bacterium]|nr:NlpC/P60 family protein [Gaiellaceae bacterium]
MLAEIEAIDMQLDRAVDAYNGATLRLEEIEGELAENASRLRAARAGLRTARERAAERLVQLYTSGEPETVEVLLGATSFSDLLDRIDTASRIAVEDARIAGEVERYEGEVERRGRELEEARAEQEEVVERRAAQRAEIQDQLAERQRLYESIEGEIERLRAAEQARQARLAEQAREEAAAAQRPEADGSGQATASQPKQPAPAPEPTPGPAPSPPPAPAPSPPAGPGHPEVVPIALRYLGIPYRWGGASPSTGFDCSGFVMYVYGKIGISLPHHAASQYAYGRPVARSQLVPGDIVFFNGLGHNGIYVGGGRFVHSPHTGDVVKISSLYDSWYASTWVGARRL